MMWLNGLWSRWRSRVDYTLPTAFQVLVWLAMGLVAFATSGWLIRGPWLWSSLWVLFLLASLWDRRRLLRFGVPEVKRSIDQRPQIGLPQDVVFRVITQQPLQEMGETRSGQIGMKRIAQMEIYPGVPEWFARESDIHLLPIQDRDDSWLFVQTIRPLRRGLAKLQDVEACWKSPWGWWSRTHRYRTPTPDSEWLVLPDVTSWRKSVIALQQTLLHEGQHAKRLVSGNTEFSHIADYSPDDDPRHINWAAVARRGRLMKNVYQPERGQQIMVAIDASRYMGVPLPDGKTRLDYAVECAAAIVQTAMTLGDSVGVCAFTHEVILQLAPDRGAAHWSEVVKELAKLEAKTVQGGYQALFQTLSGRFHRRSLLIVLSELEGLATDDAFFSTLATFQRRHPTLFVTVHDVDAIRQSQAFPRTAKDLPRIAAAEWILRDRAKAMQSLRQHGVSAIESAPGSVVVDTVQAYIARKQRYTL